MLLNPRYDLLEVVLHRAGVEEIARGVAIVQGAIDVVRLALEHTDAIVQLLGHAVVLVTAYIARLGEHGVVSGDLCDIRVFAIAEFEVVVAWLRILRQRCRACGGPSWCPGPVTTANFDERVA